MLVKKVIILCFFLALTSFQLHAQRIEYGIKRVIFHSLDNKYSLDGILKSPSAVSSNGKCAILISPPLAFDYRYNGFFDSLSDSLCRNGFTVLSYNNRNFKYSEFGMRMSMHIQAEDAVAALKFLREEKSLQKLDIGFIGHSEGAASVTIACSKGADPDFCILLSPIGTNGDIVSNIQRERLMKTSNSVLIDSIILKINLNNRKIIQLVKDEANIKELKRKAIQIMINFYKQNPEVLVEYNKVIDSLKGLNYLPKDANKNFFRNLDSSTITEIYSKEFETIFNAGQIDFIRYVPEQYVSEIKCPLLILYGSQDILLNPETNAQNLKLILDKSANVCYKITIIRDVDHSFFGLTSDEKMIDRFANQVVASSLIKNIIEWFSNKEDLCEF